MESKETIFVALPNQTTIAMMSLASGYLFSYLVVSLICEKNSFALHVISEFNLDKVHPKPHVMVRRFKGNLKWNCTLCMLWCMLH